MGLLLFKVFMKVLEKAFCKELGKFAVNTELFRI